MTLSVSAYVASVSLPSLEGFQEPQAIDEAVKLGLGLVMAGTDHCVCGLGATQAWMGVPEPQVFLCNILSGKISNMYLKTNVRFLSDYIIIGGILTSLSTFHSVPNKQESYSSDTELSTCCATLLGSPENECKVPPPKQRQP